MPALRQTMHARHEVIHIAQWPTAHELHQLASRQYAFEGGCFVLCCGSTLTKSQVLEGYRSLGTDAGYELLESIDDEQLMSGGAAIIGPDTRYIEGPAGPDVEIVSAEFDPGITAESGLLLDTDGHYSRPDIFTLKVNRTAQVNVTENEDATGE